MRLIDADALKADLIESKEKLWEIYNGLSNHIDKQICAGQIGSFVEAILRIKDAPTIDAVPVSEIKAYLQKRLDEWYALGDRKFEPANMWGYNFIAACFDDLEREDGEP